MREIIIIFFLTIMTISVVGQPKSPTGKKGVNPIALIKTAVIKQIKSELALPKYYKTEKLTVRARERRYFTEYVGIGEVPLWDTVQIGKYLLLSQDAEYDDLESGMLYEIDSRNISYESVLPLVEVVLFDSNLLLKKFFYLLNPEAKSQTELVRNKELKDIVKIYNGVNIVKRRSDQFYDVEIYYWAMSKGGTVRLYHEIGLASIDKNGKVSYIGDLGGE